MKTLLKVKGMKCSGCETTIQESVQSCTGVASVKASHRDGTVEIDYDENLANLESIRQAIISQGFQVG